jgi:hypothetical protein
MERWYQKRGVKMTALVVLILAVLFLLWANFFYQRVCENKACFNDYLIKCQQASYINNENNIALEYNIIGSLEGKCRVKVKFLEGQLQETDVSNLVNKEMVCAVPGETIIKPEADLDSCHGDLKEELQKLIISKMHRYIVQNLGKINSEILTAI